MLAIMMDEGIGAGYLIFLAHNATTSKRRRRPTNPDVREPNTRVRNAVAVGREMTRNHRTAKVGEDGEDVGDGLVELEVGECGDRRAHGGVFVGDRAIGAFHATKDRRR